MLREVLPRSVFALTLAAAVTLGPACDTSGSELLAPPCSISPPSPPDWRLTADGATFRDGLGRQVFLRGVDAGGRSKFAPYVPFDYPTNGYAAALASYMDRAASWGIDVLRVPFTWAAVESVEGTDDENFLSMYDALLDAAWARGMWTVIDFHQDVYSEVFCGDGFPAWTVPNAPAPHHDCPNWGSEYLMDTDVQAAFDRLWAQGSPIQDAMLSLWDRMVARYKDKPGVLGFEIINEPGWGTQAVETFESGSLTTFYARAVPRIQAEAPSSLLFLDPTGFAGEFLVTGLTPPAGASGIVFAPHYYQLGADDGYGKPDAVLGDLEKWVAVGATWNAPVFLGEFGVNDTVANAQDFMRAHFEALDALGMSGTEWEYSVSVDAWNDESDGIVAADGTELPVAGAVLRPFAKAVAGSAITSSYDATSRTFKVSYTPQPGITEISMPARVFPAGYAVTGTGACVDTSQAGVMRIRATGGPVSITATGQ